MPGLKIVAPSSPWDAKALLKAAIRDDNPVLFLEHKRLYGVKAEAPETEPEARLGVAAVVREGADVTLVSVMKGVHDCLAAAEELAADGIDAEVIDLRTIRPLDEATILASLAKTNRLVVVEEGPRTGGWGGEVVAVCVEQGLGDVDDVWRIATPDHPIPYSPSLEDAFLPGADAIAESVRHRLGTAGDDRLKAPGPPGPPGRPGSGPAARAPAPAPGFSGRVCFSSGPSTPARPYRQKRRWEAVAQMTEASDTGSRWVACCLSEAAVGDPSVASPGGRDGPVELEEVVAGGDEVDLGLHSLFSAVPDTGDLPDVFPVSEDWLDDLLAALVVVVAVRFI